MPSEDDDDDGAQFAPRPSKHADTLRARVFGAVVGTGSALGKTREGQVSKSISTAPGRRGAGETETEADEPPRHLPTARIVPPSSPLIPPNTLSPILFEFCRLLSIVPALIGTLFNLYNVYQPPDPHMRIGKRRPPERIDFFVSALWSLLTGIQCLYLTTGLLTRWRLYYPPLSTLIRLIALQAICWPATHLTLTILEHRKRPVLVWAVIASTTSVSRSVQIWVTSNLWWEEERDERKGYWRRWREGKWSGRRWDWKEVGRKCVWPLGVLYFVMAWAEALRREWSDC